MEAGFLQELFVSIPDHDIVRWHTGFSKTGDDCLDYRGPGTEKWRSVGGHFNTDDIAWLYQGSPGESHTAFAGHGHNCLVHHSGDNRIIGLVIENRVRTFSSDNNGTGRHGRRGRQRRCWGLVLGATTERCRKNDGQGYLDEQRHVLSYRF